MQTPSVNPIIDLESPLEKVLKKGEYIAIKCHNTPGDNDSGFYEINLPYHGGGKTYSLKGFSQVILLHNRVG